jgi:Vanillate O-demethylase oxygenase C-terminal domain
VAAGWTGAENVGRSPGGRCLRFRNWETGEWAVVAAGPYRWRCDAARQVENFTDFGHFPWVHPGLLGDPQRPVVPRHQVHADGHVLRYEIVRPEAPNSEDFPVFGNEQAGPPERRSRYELHLPYTIVLRLGWGGQRGMVYFFASQPAAADRCAGYVVIGRNYNTDQPDQVIRDFEDTIFGQDQVVVESQRPERVPFDLAAELHLRFDAVAVAYRKAMRDLGLAASAPIGITVADPAPVTDHLYRGPDALHGPVFQYVMPGNCSRACSSWSAHSRGQPKARAAWPLMSAAAAPLVKWTYSPQFIRRV